MMGEFCPLLDLEKKSIGGKVYYIRPGTETQIVKNNETKNRKTSGKDWYDALVQQIRTHGSLNVLNFAREELSLNDHKSTEFVKGFVAYVSKNCPDIVREVNRGVPGDVFRVR